MRSENIVTAMEYIKENPGKTVNQLVDYMEKKGKCSRLTTLKIVDEIIKSEKVEDRKDKPNGFHSLYINDKDEFNRINMRLSEIEAFIDEMSEPIRNYKNGKEYLFSHVVGNSFILQYDDYTSMILQSMLVRVNKLINSQNDAKLLYSKIVELIIKLNKQGIHRFQTDQIDNFFSFVKDFISYRQLDRDDPRKTRLVRNLRIKFRSIK